MKLLALETTQRVGGVAVMDSGELLAEHHLDETQRSARSLAPAIRKILAEVAWRPEDVRLVAVVRGPGSFTGLRVGITAAKLFAYAAGSEVLGVGTLEAIAAGCPDAVDRVAVAVDAQRGEVVAGSFRRDSEGRMTTDLESRLLPWDRWLDELPDGTPIAGPILGRKADAIPSHLVVLEPEFWCPRASTVARLAFTAHANGRRDDPYALAPIYSRPSAAEERRLARKQEP